jgi:hypothetical protein
LSSSNNGWHTRRIYKLESDLYRWPDKWSRRRPIKFLRNWINEYYTAHAGIRVPVPPPTVRVGKGAWHHVRYTSFYHTPRHYIEFVPSEMNLITAAHELVHAFGTDDHGPKFIRAWSHLLTQAGMPNWWIWEVIDDYKLATS